MILQKEAAVNELSTVLGQRETSLKESSDELQKKEQAIIELTGFVRQKEASLEVLDQSIQQKEAAIQELSGYLTQKEAAVQELGKALGSKEEEVKVLYSELDSLREQREELSMQVRSFDEQVGQQLQQLEQVQQERATVEEELKELSEVLESTHGELSEAQAQLEKREAQLERLVELHDRQQSRIVDLQATVQQQEDYMSSLNKAIAYNTEKISGLHHELSGVKHELSSVQQSLSYRLGRATTYPLRWFFPVGSQRSQYLQTFLMVLVHPISTLRVFKKLGFRSAFKAFKTQSPEQLSTQLSRAIRNSDSMVTADASLKRLKDKPRIAVMLHLYYTDLWPEALSYLQHLPYEYDLWVNLVSGSAADAELDVLTGEIQSQVNGARVIVSENRGRDMGGFIQLIQQMDLDQYDVFCKVHTKKSFHRQDGDVWRRDLLQSVLGEEVIRPVLDLFMADESIGVIGSQKYYMDFDPSVGTNDPFVRSLLRRFGIQEKRSSSLLGRCFGGESKF